MNRQAKTPPVGMYMYTLSSINFSLRDSAPCDDHGNHDLMAWRNQSEISFTSYYFQIA